MSGSDFTRTQNLGLYKPTPNADTGTWGIHLNSNADVLDSAVLPSSGGTVTGPLMLTATGGSVARSEQDRWADTINVKDYGATGTGTTDDTAAIQAAANAIPAAGGILLLPAGTYRTTATILILSNTTVRGPGTLLAGTSFGDLLNNAHNTTTALTDHDIAVEGMTFDYGSSGAGGSAHCVMFNFVRNVRVRDCTFQCRGAGNATAMVGCYNSLVIGCTSYGHSNCAYDHWYGPAKARVIGCHAETAIVAPQMVLFNPENTAGGGSGLVAEGFVLADCTFTATGSNTPAIQIEPLATGNNVRNATVSGNVFRNVSLAMRGAVRGATVRGNVFYQLTTTAQNFESYGQFSGTPDGIVFSGNSIVDPQTTSGNYAAVMMTGISSVCSGNAFSGSNVYCASYTGPQVAVSGNSYPSTSAGAMPNTGANSPVMIPGVVNAANDAAAAAAGCPVYGTYRNGSVLMVRIT